MKPLLLDAGCREATAAKSGRREATVAGRDGVNILLLDGAARNFCCWTRDGEKPLLLDEAARKYY